MPYGQFFLIYAVFNTNWHGVGTNTMLAIFNQS